MPKTAKNELTDFVKKKADGMEFSSWRDDTLMYLSFGVTTIGMSYKDFEVFMDFTIKTWHKYIKYNKEHKNKGSETLSVKAETDRETEENKPGANDLLSKSGEEFDLRKLVLDDSDAIEHVDEIE